MLGLFAALFLALLATLLFLVGLWHLIQKTSLADRLAALAKALGLKRADFNPVLTAGTSSWESVAVMNPAAVEIDGTTHMFYRAIGSDGVSRIGYARSSDGIHFDRLPYPVFAINHDIRMTPTRHAGLIASGGGVAGAEDPRAIVMDGKVHLTFQAFAGWDSLRIGITTISVDDLQNGKWNWSHPVYISPPDKVMKNWVIFPEKINGKYAVLHAFLPGDRNTALIEYLDSLEEEPKEYIQGNPRFRDDVDDAVWDSRVRGVGPPPIKTSKGWLVFYHANDSREPHKYKLGALLLDLADPTKVIARSNRPVLSPDANYENDGKPGIVYACGATLSGDTLRVYYGGADNVVCAAETSLKKLLTSMLASK